MNKRRYLVIVAIVVAAVGLSILFYTMQVNHRPAIAGLEAEPDRVLTSGNCQIICDAIDPDGDEMTYEWSAGAGGLAGEGATASWTAPGRTGSYNVTVIVKDGHGGEATAHVTITVRTNWAPTINNLEASSDWTTPSGILQLTCSAKDLDGDELNYAWTDTGGDISGTGAVVNWTAPQAAGTFNITVVVRDGYGGGATRTVLLSVSPGTPPTIGSLTITAKEHKYLKESRIPGCDYDVWIMKEYYIECVLADASGPLVYDWSCDGGEISGKGSTIIWIAPNRSSVKVTVTVMVSDVAGNQVGKNLVLHVPSCTCGF